MTYENDKHKAAELSLSFEEYSTLTEMDRYEFVSADISFRYFWL